MGSSLRKAAIPQGSVVGISTDEGSRFLKALFGVLQAGCVALPVAPNLSETERLRVLGDSMVSATINTLDSNSPTTEQDPHNWFQVRSVLPQEKSTASRSLIKDVFNDAAVMRHTSGTTASSKGVVLSHKAVLERVRASRALLEIDSGDSMLICLPISYHFIASALACLYAGTTIIDASLLGPRSITDAVRTYNANILYAAPSQYGAMVLLPRHSPRDSFPSLRRAIATSALLPSTLAIAFEQRFTIRLTQVYGIIEVGLPLWNTEPCAQVSALGTCRSPYQCSIVSPTGDPVRCGESGELCIRGPGLFSGYLVGANAGLKHGEQQWFKTGDLVTQDNQGVITYRGRLKTVINSDGFTVFPEEIEEVLQTAPDIEEVRVSGKLDPRLGNRIIAEIVSKNYTPCAPDAWRALCQKTLSQHQVPHEFILVESLPHTGSGKIMRR